MKEKTESIENRKAVYDRYLTVSERVDKLLKSLENVKK